MNEALVSIVIATNRHGKFLGEALDSVSQQTYPHWEIVIVDDGAPDPAAVDAIVEGRPKVRVIHQTNAGVSTARNVGVAASAGSLLAFLDDDDVWTPRRLEFQIGSLRSNAGAIAAYGRMRGINTDGIQIAPADQQEATDIRSIRRRLVAPIFGTLLVQRTAFERVGGFHPAFSHAEDLDLILRLVEEGELVFVDVDLGGYRLHRENVTLDKRATAEGVRAVLGVHRFRARRRGDLVAVGDLKAGLRRNRMFGAWVASGQVKTDIRKHRWWDAGRDAIWGIGFAREAPILRLWEIVRTGRISRRAPESRRTVH